MRFVTLFILLVATLLHTGCNIINPTEEVPTYVHIDSFTFTSTQPDLTGTNRQAITSVWAYLDGANVGVFELPADIPVLLSRKSQLQLAPGVRNQGLNDYHIAYPFFEFYNVDLEPTPGKVITLQPETRYIANLQYWKESFENGGGQFIKLSGDTAIRRVQSADSVYEGGGAGVIVLNSNYPTSENIATLPITPGTQCWLEIHYRGTLAFQVGGRAIFSGNTPYAYLAGVKPKEEWGKLYVDMAQFTRLHPNALAYSVIIKSELGEGQSDGYLLLDNIKVISY